MTGGRSSPDISTTPGVVREDFSSQPLTLAAPTLAAPTLASPRATFSDLVPLTSSPWIASLPRFATCPTFPSRLAAPFREAGVTHVAGMEARGFMFGGMLADVLGAGFIPVRKGGKLPWKTYREQYALEYGTDTLEIHQDAAAAGHRVLIHDDVIATGGTAAAAHALLRQTGADVAGFTFLIELGFLNGRRLLGADVPVHSVLTI
jgi:adenine phosphoribosyltransferase